MSEKPTICRHGCLRRSCETCDLAEDVERLERERDHWKEQSRKWCDDFTKLEPELRRVVELAKQCKTERDAALKALATRTKQMGVACMEHDLTHSLACGHCYAEALEALRALVGDLDLRAELHAKLRGEDEVRVPVSDGILQRARAILAKGEA